MRADKRRARFGAAYWANRPTITWVSISVSTTKLVEAIARTQEAMRDYAEHHAATFAPTVAQLKATFVDLTPFFKSITFTPEETP